MSTKTENFHGLEFLLSEANGYRSREKVTILSGQNLKAGAVIGKATVATTVATPGAGGNTGNGGITMDATHPVLSGAIVGTYTALCVGFNTNSGTFEVTDPNGKSIGSIGVGGTFADQIKFVIADGSTDYVVGDKFTIVVTAGTGKCVAVPDPLVTTVYDGTDVAYGILADAVDATSADTVGMAIVRAAEVDGGMLIYTTTAMAGLTATQLGAVGLIVR